MKLIALFVLSAASLIGQNCYSTDSNVNNFTCPGIPANSILTGNGGGITTPTEAPNDLVTWKDAKISLDVETKALFVNHKLMGYIEKMDQLWSLWSADGHLLSKFDDLEAAKNEAEDLFVPKPASKVKEDETDPSAIVSAPKKSTCEMWVIVPDPQATVYCGDHEATDQEIKEFPVDGPVTVYQTGDPNIPKHTAGIDPPIPMPHLEPFDSDKYPKITKISDKVKM